MPEYPIAHRVLARLSGVWTDLTSYVIEEITGKWGIQGNGPLDFLADPGSLRITLNNMDQRFTPGHSSALAGWRKGIRIKLEIDYDSVTYPMLGTIGDIDIPLKGDMIDKAYVTIVDWLEYSARDPIVNPGILTDQRGDQVIKQTVEMMPIPPQAMDLDEGAAVFPTAFDTVTSHTKAYSEFSKVAFSETGYMYLLKDHVFGETLVFESAYARHGWRPLDDLPLPTSGSGFLLKEDGGKLLKEDGDGLLLDQVSTLLIDNDMLDLEADYGKRMINYFTVRANPRRLDSSPQILFRLNEPIPIASGQTVTIKGSYADPNGGQPINGQDMITPVATTDYLANTAQDGSGTNITASLVLVRTTYGTEGFTHEVRNASGGNGWITQYNTRGYGIYLYNPIEHVEQDGASIKFYGTQTESMDQKYQTELAWGTLYTAKVVEREKEPRTVLYSVTLLANQSPALMIAFLQFGPGKLIRIKHTKRGIDAYFYIQGVKNVRITEGGLIMFTWIVKESLSLLLGLSMLAVEFGGAGTTDAVRFGTIPYLNNLPQRSVSAWIYVDQYDPTGTILGNFSDSAGFLFYVGQTNHALRWYQKFPSGAETWGSPTDSIPTGAWVHVVASREGNSDVLPKMYINGAPVVVTKVSGPISPAENPNDEIGTILHIGNIKTGVIDYTWGFDGKIMDVRIYDRILTDAEVATLYNSGQANAALVTDGLVFQAFAVRTKLLSDYLNVRLTSGDKLLDNIYGAVGTPNGQPWGRS